MTLATARRHFLGLQPADACKNAGTRVRLPRQWQPFLSGASTGTARSGAACRDTRSAGSSLTGPPKARLAARAGVSAETCRSATRLRRLGRRQERAASMAARRSGSGGGGASAWRREVLTHRSFRVGGETTWSRARNREPGPNLHPPPLVLNQTGVLKHVQGAGNWRPEAR